jgi:iron complex outermembrane receptor protein
VQGVADLALVTPGLDIATYQGDASIFIRGIGTPSIIAGNDSSTATYVDGVYLSRAAAIAPAFFDVERVEVLRGPQGTLYGRNATGGAVNIITRGPGDELSGEVGLTIGNYGLFKTTLAAGGPINDTMGLRVALQKENRDGYTKLIRPDNSREDVEDKDDFAARIHFRWDMTDALRLSLIGDYYRADDKAAVFHFASTGYAEEVPGWYSSREGSQTGAYFAYRAGGRVSESASRDLYSDIDYKNEIDVSGVTMRLDWQAAFADVALIANYKETEPFLQNEFDSSDAFVNLYQRGEKHRQHSLDLQFSSNGQGPFRWIAGASFFAEDNEITNNIFGEFWEPILIAGFTQLQQAGVIPTFPINIPDSSQCCTLQLNGTQDTRAWAAYLDASYDLGEQLTLHLGMRHSNEERDGAQQFQLLFAGQRFAPNTLFFPNAVSDDRDAVPDPLGFVVAPVQGPAEFEAFTPKLGLDYRLNDDVLIYAQVQKGFKSGGYNIGSSQMTPFKPEKIWSYELGLKSEWLDRRLRINSALFHYRYENLQAQDSIGNQPIIRNVGKSEVTGFESEILARLGDAWQFDAAVAYLDAKFTEGELTEPLRPAPLDQAPGSTLRDLDGLSLTRAPRWKVNVGIQYFAPQLAIGQLSARVDYAWQSKVYYTVFNLDAASQGSYGVLNLRLMLDDEVERWSLAAYAKNLNDETYFGNQILTGTVYGAEFVGSLAPPRTFGIEANYRF